MATFRRHCLGWDQPVLAAVAKRLLNPASGDATHDLSNTLVIVPTRESGRRLREALAFLAARDGGGLFPPLVGTPLRLLQSENTVVATPLQIQLALTRALLDAPPGTLSRLLPEIDGETPSPTNRFERAFALSDPLCELRNLLAENGLLFGDVAPALGEGFEDAERWDELAALERVYFQRLADIGAVDPIAARRTAAETPSLPEQIRRVVVAACPDVSPPAESALHALADSRVVEIWIHAPTELADAFDACGRPITKFWAERHIPLREEWLVPLADVDAQAREATRMLIEGGAQAGDTVFGVPGEETVAPLVAELGAAGVRTFDPGGLPLAQHSLCRVLKHLHSLATDGSYEAFSALLRHPDLLDFLGAGDESPTPPPAQSENASDVSPHDLLVQADIVQNEHLPEDLDTFANFAINAHPTFTALHQAVEAVQHLCATFHEGGTLPERLRRVLQRLYERRNLRGDRVQDREFITSARTLIETFDALEGVIAENLVATDAEERAALDRLLETTRYYFPEPGDDLPDADVQGWLELHWNDAPNLVIVGFNDHAVPESAVGHPFLPDTIRATLGLTDNRRRFARDAYLFSAMLAVRGNGRGEVRILFGRQNAQGDVRRPSRLLFCDAPENLPARALRLFGPVAQHTSAPAWQRSWQLVPSAPKDAPRQLDHLSVTAFSDYLRCPFRFYLKRVLRMEARDDRKRELEPVDFGNLIHAALSTFGEQRELRNSDDPEQIAAFLINVLHQRVAAQFGPRPPVAVQLQIEAAEQRLRAAARVQAKLSAEGWEIVAVEQDLDATKARVLTCLPVRGRIDRIDQHRDGRVRLLDYKTAESRTNPAKQHLGPARDTTPDYARWQGEKKARAWLDLQLPLYALLHPCCEAHETPECGFFSLPKAVTETGVDIWERLDESMLESAAACARGVAEAIRKAQFWPPAEKVPFDDFDRLFYGTAEESIRPPTPL